MMQMTRMIAASKFKERCLALLEEVGPEGLVITKRGKPIARLTPIANSSADLIGCLAKKIRVRGNIMSTGLQWDAQSRHAHPHPRAHR